MQLKVLARTITPRRVIGSLDREVESISYDSRRVQSNTLFVAIRGEKSDGHQFVDQAIEQGASVIVAEREISSPRATCLVVDDSRSALADLSAAFYGMPAHKLKMAAVTGTNGKTTTTFLIKHICEKAGMRCGLLGTVQYEIGDRILPAIRTTPEALDIQELLAQIVNAGGRAAAMEVSSQSKKKKASAVINIDDRYGEKLIGRLAGKTPVVTYGLGMHADFRASNYRTEFAGTSYQLDARGRSDLVRVPLIGRFNVANSMAALAAATVMGVNLRAAILSLARSPQVPGRLELVPAKRQFQIFVDYAHTDDALRNVLKTLRELKPRKLIVVFGCGGDRDRKKRPLMGRVTDELADHAIITSDNPRKENPDAIINEVERGFRSTHYEKIVERAEAI